MVTIVQQPTAGSHYSNSELIFSVTSDQLALDPAPTQFNFVYQAFEGTTMIFEGRIAPNAVRHGIVDLSSVFDSRLEYDLGALGSAITVAGNDSTKTFTVRFGEEFANANGTVTGRTGADNEPVGAPAIASNALTVLKGVRPYNEGLVGEALTLGTLSNVIENRIHRDDDMVISHFASGLPMHTPVIVPTTGSSLTTTIGGVAYTFEIYDRRSRFGEDRFAWINDNDGWDFYTADQIITTSVSVSKDTSFVGTTDRGRSTSTNRERANANVFRRSSRVNSIDRQTTNSRQTRWLSRTQASSLEGIYHSPVVLKQVGTTWVPVDILNQDYQVNLAGELTEQFNYLIEYRNSNDLRRK